MAVLTNYSTPNDTDWWTITESIRIAQSFQISTAAVVNSATLRTAGAAANTTGLEISIQTNNSGTPSGTLAGANLIGTISTITDTAFNTRSVNFGGGNQLLANTTYWLTGKSDSETGTQSNRWSADGAGSYTNGNVDSRDTGGSWTPQTLYDNWFTVEGPDLSSGLQNKYW